MKNLLFVDDEPRILQGLQRMLHGMREEWHMHFLSSGQSALEFMVSTPVDVIVTDMKMPGMDGDQLLTEVMKRHPQCVRVVLSGHADRESILRLVGPAHQYLCKPCNAEDLRTSIHRAFSLRDLVSNERLKLLATRLNTMPSLPTLHTELTEELRREEPSVDRVSAIVAKDIGMTSKLLQLVNSAFFGLPQPINDPREAVMYLGLATVRALVLSLQVFSLFEQRRINCFSIEQLTRHSWRVSLYAKRIAQAERGNNQIEDQCFLAGLLHDLGQLILAAGLPEEYAHVLASARNQAHTIWEAEQAKFGATHAELGGYLLGLWGLPNPVIEAVAFHHRPADAPASGFSPVTAVHVANAFAHDAEGTHPEWPGNSVDYYHLSKLGLEQRVAKWRELCSREECNLGYE